MKNLLLLAAAIFASSPLLALGAGDQRVWNEPDDEALSTGRLKTGEFRIMIPGIWEKFEIVALSVDGQSLADYDSFIEVSSPTRTFAIRDESGREVPAGRVPLEKGRFSGEIILKGSGLDLKRADLSLSDLKGNLSRTGTSFWIIPGFLTLIPPLLAILLAIATREIYISLLLGIFTGAFMITGFSPFRGFYEMATTYVAGSFLKEDHVMVILFSLMLSGTVGVIRRAGGMNAIVERLKRVVKSVRSASFTTFLMGGAIFFDDYTSCLITGASMRPITDRFRISREKLSYLVDSTAAPVASFLIISTWIGYEVGLFSETLQNIGIEENPYLLFLRGIPYQFYPIFTLIFIVFLTLSVRDFGPMRKAEKRARREGKVIAEGDFPLMATEFEEKGGEAEGGNIWQAIIPISFIITGTLVGLLVDGYMNMMVETEGRATLEGVPLYYLLGKANSFRVLLVVTLLGSMIASSIAILTRTLDLKGISESWVKGVTSLMPAMVILILAWSMSRLCHDLKTASYVSSLLKSTIPVPLFPLLVFITSGLIGFSTGTSWGTMAILIPIVIPLSYGLSTQTGQPDPSGSPLFLSSIMAVLGGSVFGDHISPISDTTIISSMASSSDHIAHVNTQLPYGVTVSAVAILAGYLPAGFGIEWYLSLPAGIFISLLIIIFLGRSSAPSRIVSEILDELKSARPEEKERLLSYLSGIEDSSAIEALLEIADAGDTRDRLIAIGSILNGYGERGKPLIGPYLNDPDPMVRATVVRGVGRFAAEEDLDLIRKGILDIDPRVRANAVEALGLMGQRSDPIPLIPLLEERINDSEPRVVSTAVTVLWKLTGNRRYLSILKEMVEKGDERAIISVIFALGEIKEIIAIDILSEKARDAKERIRSAARSALEKHGFHWEEE